MRSFLIMLLASITFWSMACSSSDFTSTAASGGSGGKKNGNDKSDNSGGDDDADGGHDVDDAGGDDDIGSDDDGMNPDGTFTQRFRGSLTKLESGSDIVFAVDTSGSMNAEKTRLQEHMATFLNKFSEESKKLDYRVYLLGKGFTFPQGLGERFEVVTQSVSSHNALAILQNFFNGQYALGRPIREKSKKQIVVVTDDNAKVVTADVFKQYVVDTPMLKGKTSVNGFVILQNSALSSWCTKAEVGTEYVKLADDPETKGTIYDLCTTDWSALLKTLAEKLLEEVPRERFELSKEPESADAIKVKVDGSTVEQPDWSYDEATNEVVFTRDAAPGKNMKVEVTFTPQ